MGVERNRASWISVAALNEDPGVSAKRLSALAALFLSLRRHDPDQVRRVAARPAASQPPVGAPLGCSNYPQSAALPSRLQAPGRSFGKTAVFEPVQHPCGRRPQPLLSWQFRHCCICSKSAARLLAEVVIAITAHLTLRGSWRRFREPAQ